MHDTNWLCLLRTFRVGDGPLPQFELLSVLSQLGAHDHDADDQR